MKRSDEGERGGEIRVQSRFETRKRRSHRVGRSSNEHFPRLSSINGPVDLDPNARFAEEKRGRGREREREQSR